jgi:hypothetical protein
MVQINERKDGGTFWPLEFLVVRVKPDDPNNNYNSGQTLEPDGKTTVHKAVAMFEMVNTQTEIRITSKYLLCLINGSSSNSKVIISIINGKQKQNVQGGSNMTGTDLCVNKPHKTRSYLNHLVLTL